MLLMRSTRGMSRSANLEAVPGGQAACGIERSRRSMLPTGDGMKGTTLRSGQHAPHSLARQAQASAADLTDGELIAALPGAILSTAEGLCSVPVRRAASIAGWIYLHQIWYKRAMASPDKVLVARFYRLASGREPAREWLLELSAEDRKSIGRDLMKIEFGWPCGPPLCRPLTGLRRPIRGAQQADGWQERQGVLHRVGRDHVASARLHQEEPSDAREGAEAGGTAEERL